ncbi:hypothetical protein [Persicitalea sp.]|uniref:hypothetical protein n=1 Tax=Persicitalea sp. TaxID=3100273 RepID=UPI003592EE97
MKLIILTGFLIAFFAFEKNGENSWVNPSIDKRFAEDSVLYLQKSIEFIKEVKAREMSDTNFVLVDTPAVYNLNKCLERTTMDTVTFTEAERDYLKRKQYPKLGRWKDEHFSKTKIIGRHTLMKIFKLAPPAGWEFFKKHVGTEGYHIFSYPIFLKNYTYCLFYSEYYCEGIFCADGQLDIYKFENGKWISIGGFCAWSA